MSAEFLVIILFGIVIIFLLFLVFVMQKRIRQLLREVKTINHAVSITCTELESLTKNVEEFKQKNLK